MKKLVFPILAAGAVLLLAGCSSAEPAPPSESEGELIPVTLGVIPIADTAAAWLGQQEGFFEDEGIDLTIETTTGGAAAVPGVVSGDFEFAFGNVVTIMVANDQGLDVRYVANGASAVGTSDGPSFGGVVVPADSDIESAADLAGKTVSSNNLSNINDTTIRAGVDAAGGDQSAIEFVEIAFPDAAAALENGQVDAAMMAEPFLSAAIAGGDRVVLWNYEAVDPDLDIAGFFATGDYIDQNPELVAAFTRAMDRSLEFAAENPDAVRDIIGTYTKIPDEARATMALPVFRVDFDLDAQEKLAAVAVEYGTMTAVPDIARIFGT